MTFGICLRCLRQGWHAGRSFRPVSSQQIYQAVAELCKGSSPSQLASLELELQQRFKAPSFAALGHGSSLLQLCGQDEQVMKIVSSAGLSLAPLAQVTAYPCSATVQLMALSY